MTEAWATAMALAIAAVVVIGGVWAWKRWRGLLDQRRRTGPEMAVRTLHSLGRWLIAVAEVLDSAIVSWRDTVRQRRLLLTRSEVDRELRKGPGIRKSMEAWKP